MCAGSALNALPDRNLSQPAPPITPITGVKILALGNALRFCSQMRDTEGREGKRQRRILEVRDRARHPRGQARASQLCDEMVIETPDGIVNCAGMGGEGHYSSPENRMLVCGSSGSISPNAFMSSTSIFSQASSMKPAGACWLWPSLSCSMYGTLLPCVMVRPASVSS